MHSKNIQKLIDLFSRFPTVGKRTAGRFAFYLINSSKEEAEDLILSIKRVKELVRLCSFCNNPFEPEQEELLCPICQDSRRDKTIICLVEKEADLDSIEKIKKYNGLYFILGSLIKEDKMKELEERIRNPKKFGIEANIKEAIIATNSTYEGQAMGLFLERKLKEIPGLKISKLARGMQTGSEIEYADQETLESAFEGRH